MQRERAGIVFENRAKLWVGCDVVVCEIRYSVVAEHNTKICSNGILVSLVALTEYKEVNLFYVTAGRCRLARHKHLIQPIGRRNI